MDLQVNTFWYKPELGKRNKEPYRREEVDVIMFVYDVGSSDSFKNIADWILYIRGMYNTYTKRGPHVDDCVYYIIGNKSDLKTKR